MIRGLPEKLQQLRARHGLSQREAAEFVGVSPSIMSGYETGERTPSTLVLLSLSNLYRCSTDYLLGKERTPQNTLDITGLTEQQFQAIQALIDVMKK